MYISLKVQQAKTSDRRDLFFIPVFSYFHNFENFCGGIPHIRQEETEIRERERERESVEGFRFVSAFYLRQAYESPGRDNPFDIPPRHHGWLSILLYGMTDGMEIDDLVKVIRRHVKAMPDTGTDQGSTQIKTWLNTNWILIINPCKLMILIFISFSLWLCACMYQIKSNQMMLYWHELINLLFPKLHNWNYTV